jgi:cell division protein FtsB
MINFIKEHRKFIIISLIAVIAILFILFSDRGLLKRISLNGQKSELQNKISRELEIHDSLTNSIDKLQYDTVEIERIAREYYGMIKPGEKIYSIIEEKDTEHSK